MQISIEVQDTNKRNQQTKNFCTQAVGIFNIEPKTIPWKKTGYQIYQSKN